MRRLLLCASFLAATACGGSEAARPLAEGDAHFTIAFRTKVAKTGRLVGWNLGRGTYYAPEGDSFHPEWRTPERVAAIAKLRDVRAPGGPQPYVRFSGLQIDGAFGADGYHFWDFVKPGRTVSATDNMAVFEYAALATELQGELTVTLDFGSGTAAEAARYVTYLNGTNASDPVVAARLASSHPAPYGVSVFEIGNESYGAWNTGAVDTGAYSYGNPAATNGGDPPWYGRPSSSAADYAARALEYVNAVRAVEPNARFRVPLSQASMDAWGGPGSALPALRPLLVDPAVDAVVVHFYQAEDGTTLGVGDINAADFTLMGAELFRPLFTDLRTRLAELPRATPLGIAVTEYHVADGFSRGTFQLGTTAAVGLGLADMLVFLAQMDVDHACQHISLASDPSTDPLVEPHYDPLPGDGAGGVRETPAYRVASLFAAHILENRCEVTPSRTPRASYALPSGLVDYGLVQLTAFSSADGHSGTVFALNRSNTDSLTLTLDLDDGFRIRDARKWAPARFDEDAVATDIPIETAPYEQVGRRAAVQVPPHAVIALGASDR